MQVIPALPHAIAGPKPTQSMATDDSSLHSQWNLHSESNTTLYDGMNLPPDVRRTFRPSLPWYSAPHDMFPRKRKRPSSRFLRFKQSSENVNSTLNDFVSASPDPSSSQSASFDSLSTSNIAVSTALPTLAVYPVVPLKLPATSQPVTENGSGASVESLLTIATGNNAPVVRSWADLVKSSSTSPTVHSATFDETRLAVSHDTNMADVLKRFEVDITGSIYPKLFLEPRGLVNTGNMCFMNVVLQMLLFCTPFYALLNLLAKHSIHKPGSKTPVLDALILFMREFRVLEESYDGDFRNQHTPGQSYGRSFVPSHVYDILESVSKFSSMRRGYQQDAEEFLGFLLDSLHEETSTALKETADMPGGHIGGPTERFDLASSWTEVGKNQKLAFTRAVSHDESPITRIFGGRLRSELRIAGGPTSATLELCQSLQLDIHNPGTKSIVDALMFLNKRETLEGEFRSRGGALTAKAVKQLFMESLPPILIIHLKRFQYDNFGGTQKIWKHISYDVKLEIPKSILSASARNGERSYHLMGVIYHHGKSAQGGHYTADIRRQDARSWIRVDDTKIQAIAESDVMEDSTRNMNGGIEHSESDWEQVITSWAPAGARVSQRQQRVLWPREDSGVWQKAEKVAYILFYQRAS